MKSALVRQEIPIINPIVRKTGIKIFWVYFRMKQKRFCGLADIVKVPY